MAVAGRKPAHSNIRLLKGDRAGRDSGGRPVKAAPSFVRKAPNPPASLSTEAKAEWRRVVPELERLRIVKQPSRSSLVAYCVTWDEFTKAVKYADTLGDAAKPLDRQRALQAILAASKELRAWCSEFGLTPTSENRLSVPEEPDADEAEAIL